MLLVLLSCLPIISLDSQTIHTQTMYLYEFFPNRGYTTMGAVGQFIDLEKSNVKKIELSQNEVAQFEVILSRIEAKRHYQTKLNGCFFSTYIKDGLKNNILLSTNCIINLSNRKQYKIENTKYQEWINDLLIKYDLRKKTELEKTGVDNSLLLNNYESTYLNAIFKDSLNGFDFHGKKIGFIRNEGNSKVHYFDMQKRHIIDKNHACDNGTLCIFNAVQKEESGG